MHDDKKVQLHNHKFLQQVMTDCFKQADLSIHSDKNCQVYEYAKSISTVKCCTKPF
jgi:hypothetical protein